MCAFAIELFVHTRGNGRRVASPCGTCAPLLLGTPLAVRRASVSFTCFETSSSLTSGRTIGLGAALAFVSVAAGLRPDWAGSGRRDGLARPVRAGSGRRGPPCPPCLLPPGPAQGPSRPCVTSTFSFCRGACACRVGRRPDRGSVHVHRAENLRPGELRHGHSDGRRCLAVRPVPGAGAGGLLRV